MDQEPAVRYHNPQKRWNKDGDVQGAPKEQMFRKRQQTQPECNNGIRDWGLKEQLCLGCKGDISKFQKQTVVLEVRHCGGAGHCPSKRRDYPQLECRPLGKEKKWR
jgi:hypothetical protein